MEKQILEKSSVLRAFCQKYHIISLALFGSILTPHFNEKSDVDILVQFEKTHIPSLFGMVDMEEELTQIIGRKVDLKTAGDLSPYFRNEVVAQAKLIYGK